MNSATTVIPINKVGSAILCVIDFSEASKDALLAAVNIADETKSSLTVLYPYRLNQPRNVTDVTQWKKSIDVDATNNFNRMVNNLFKDSTKESNVLWQFKPEVGFIGDRIEAYTKKHDVRLVVMSTQLSRSSNELFPEMLGKLKCPLLIVPEKK
ncbi:MAG TPA: universal stress protein [Cyclobacteriaceae bacterium]